VLNNHILFSHSIIYIYFSFWADYSLFNAFYTHLFVWALRHLSIALELNGALKVFWVKLKQLK